MLNGPFRYEKVRTIDGGEDYRISDAGDFRIAGCYDAANAQAVTAALNDWYYHKVFSNQRKREMLADNTKE